MNNVLPIRLVKITKNNSNKEKIFSELSQYISFTTNIDKKIVFNSMLKREALGGTTLTNGIAIPHVLLDMRIDPFITVSSLKNKVSEWKDLDGEDIKVIFVLVVSKNQDAKNMKIKQIKVFFSLLADSEFLKKISGCQNEESILKNIKEKMEEF